MEARDKLVHLTQTLVTVTQELTALTKFLVVTELNADDVLTPTSSEDSGNESQASHPEPTQTPDTDPTENPSVEVESSTVDDSVAQSDTSPELDEYPVIALTPGVVPEVVSTEVEAEVVAAEDVKTADDDLDKMTIKDLKLHCQELNLKVTGTKPVLQMRITEARKLSRGEPSELPATEVTLLDALDPFSTESALDISGSSEATSPATEPVTDHEAPPQPAQTLNL